MLFIAIRWPIVICVMKNLRRQEETNLVASLLTLIAGVLWIILSLYNDVIYIPSLPVAPSLDSTISHLIRPLNWFNYYFNCLITKVDIELVNAKNRSFNSVPHSNIWFYKVHVRFGFWLFFLHHGGWLNTLYHMRVYVYTYKLKHIFSLIFTR